ncbi:SPOC-like domain-containing protein [Chloropicon primus]|uniref:SPOC-like domain-containing protein n=1 Tax=Chloropicon primus TaxID=1764295 RepID=A0A5B8ME25_9CHLO|nr:SPOC-like domain-containing protein [Chloropicon primus]UPQ97110.1 SPOC-like domain-containing protein [Chloropicon primus]|mmetsp:Transcript_10586/g.29912  ORF Transcript_10586/g.29912 Transcript_10586/m.29912 type:complete len:540 (-) Transcript_10586:687-2306(-)|eukprot:QDZ17895.1 SPOC-like domain-containing protein [Chloropicon primus]
MAPRSKSVVLCADVGRTLSDDQVQEVLRIARAILLNLVLYGGKNDSVSLVLFGATETRNALHEEMVADGQEDQYVDIVVLQDLTVVDSDVLRVLSSEEGGRWSGGRSDHLDVLTVAYDILCKDSVKAKSSKIVMVSDFKGEIKALDENFVGEVVRGIKEKECELELVTLSPITPHSLHPDETKSLVLHLRETVASLDCASDVEDYASLRGMKTTNPATTKHSFSIGSLEIPVNVYKKVRKDTMSANLRVSNYYKDEKGQVRPLKRETEYAKKDDPSDEVVTGKVQAFPYGKDLIPVDDSARNYLTHHEDKSFRLVGFHERGEFPRHLFLGEASVVLGEAKNPGSQQAVSALARALEEEDQVGVVRCVARSNSDPYLGALLPCVSQEKDIPDHLVLCMLPFAEDIREYQFASLNAAEKWIPSEEELNLAEDIIREMSLVDDKREDGGAIERVVPHELANPKILNMNEFIAEKLSGVSSSHMHGSTKANYLRVLSGPSERILARAGPSLAKLAQMADATRTTTAKKEEKVKKEEVEMKKEI